METIFSVTQFGLDSVIYTGSVFGEFLSLLGESLVSGMKALALLMLMFFLLYGFLFGQSSNDSADRQEKEDDKARYDMQVVIEANERRQREGK